MALLLLLAGVAVASTLVIYLQPRWAMGMVCAACPRVLFRVRTRKKVVALTIDDAPSHRTAELLDVLSEAGAHATFFVNGAHAIHNGTGPTGYDGRALLSRAVAEGHELANHTWHDRASVRLPLATLAREVVELEQLIASVHAAPSAANGPPRATTRWFRPGHGWWSAGMLDMVESQGHRAALGSCFPFDPHLQCAWLNAWYLRVRAHPGAVIVLHDGANRAATAETLRVALRALRAQGYTVTTLSGLVEAACDG